MNDGDPAQSAPSLAQAAAASPSGLPSVSLAIVCVLHAVPLAWGACVLPMHGGSWLSLGLGLAALLHAAVAVLALLRRPRLLRWAWLALSVYSLFWLLVATIVSASAGLYLSALYGDIGVAVGAALAAVWGLFVLLTVPVAAWGLACTTPRVPPLVAPIAALALLLLAIGGASQIRSAARAAPVTAASAGVLADLARRAQEASRPLAGAASASLLNRLPARCEQPLTNPLLTLLVTAVGRDEQSFSACLQASDAGALGQALTRLLAERQRPGTPLKLDLVRATQPLASLQTLFARAPQSALRLLEALSLRPGLDGICQAAACFAPWQLVPLEAFTRYRPLDAVRDASFGASLSELASALGAPDPEHASLLRIETESTLVQGGATTPYVRMRPSAIPRDDAALQRAVSLAGRHIVSAQRPDGAFRYLLNPFSGQTEDRLNLPRQAGTTLALCELYPGAESDAVATRALDQLRAYERRGGELSAISESTTLAELGPSALPLAALASCRARVGDRYDGLIGRLTALLLTMQRDNGSFYPELDLTTQKPSGLYEPLYAGGQAVLALVLVEQLAREKKHPDWPPRELLTHAVQRAMTFYARDYWPTPLRSLFYIEENWHCLAARAALRGHRHGEYERFCLDYVDFKSRLILQAADGVSAEHAGGYGLSDMFPPHSTATAGFGEALAAAIAVKRARGLDLQTDQARMRDVLGFVLRQQWTPDNCFACAFGSEAVGGFSESAASPAIRIDYVQHAMAALGHGGAALKLSARAR